MATFRKIKKRWRAEVRRTGLYRSKTFGTKAEAIRWAREIESAASPGGSAHSLRDAFERYAREVTPAKKGARWERVRLHLLGRYELADVRFADLCAQDLADWRDRRLLEVSGSSVNRELNVISSVIEHARKEWRWAVSNPVRDIKRPKRPQPRDRRIGAEEIRRVLLALGYDEHRPVESVRQHVAVAFLLALESAMRLGEICALRWEHIQASRGYLTLVDSKNADRRDVPLSRRAVALLGKLGGERPFPMASGTATTLFRRAVRDAGIADLRFHDSRHEAITRLARKIDVLDLARMVGHRDLKTLRVYYNATAEEIASRLD